MKPIVIVPYPIVYKRVFIVRGVDAEISRGDIERPKVKQVTVMSIRV